MRDDCPVFHRFLRSSLIVLSLIAFLPLPAHAGAWTQARGEWQLISTALYYNASRRYDNDGRVVSQPRYTKYELNPYAEYGLTDRITLGGSLFLQHLDNSADTTYGLGDTELFARWCVATGERFVLSLQPELKLPSPQAYSDHRPAIGSEGVDGGLRVLGGVSFNALGREHYADASAAYRARTAESGDQVLASATLGLTLTESLKLLPQVFHTQRLSAPNMASFTESPRDDYTLTTAQISFVYELDEANSVQAGAFAAVNGRNTGKSRGALISFWREF